MRKAKKTKAPQPQARANRRSLDVIADEINTLKRDDLFAVGDRLLEARDACDHGDWSDWLYDNFDWSEDTAANYMDAAKLPETFRKMKLAKTTFYALADEDEDLLPAILDALVKHGALKQQLKPADADDVINLARLRREHGDLPDATLLALGEEASDEIAAALKKKKPTTKEAADKIIADIKGATAAPKSDDDGGDDNTEAAAAEDSEIDSILAAGADPAVPPPAPIPPPVDHALLDFNSATMTLRTLMTKPAAQFAGTPYGADDLESVECFIRAVRKARRERAGALPERDEPSAGEALTEQVNGFIDKALEFLMEHSNSLKAWHEEHPRLPEDGRKALVNSLHLVGLEFTKLAQMIDGYEPQPTTDAPVTDTTVSTDDGLDIPASLRRAAP